MLHASRCRRIVHLDAALPREEQTNNIFNWLVYLNPQCGTSWNLLYGPRWGNARCIMRMYVDSQCFDADVKLAAESCERPKATKQFSKQSQQRKARPH